jgi:hypothetical protein
MSHAIAVTDFLDDSLLPEGRIVVGETILKLAIKNLLWAIALMLMAGFSCASLFATASSMKANFRFEDYQTVETPLQRLRQMFPQGSSSRNAIDFMKQLGAKCYEDPKKLPQLTYCHYEEKNLIVFPTWILEIKRDENQNIERLNLTRGLTGP